MRTDKEIYQAGLARLGITPTPRQHEQVELYAHLLLKWNKTLNLISKSTESTLFTRHILDCAQLLPFTQNTAEILDVGSGAGLPAIVLAILGDSKTYACERDMRKCQFLHQVKTELGLGEKFHIFNEPIQEVPAHKKQVKVITARAFADLELILSLTLGLLPNDGKLVLLKGKDYKNEIKTSLLKFSFTWEEKESITDETGRVLVISPVSRETR